MPKKQSKFDDVEFINYDLSSEQKKACKSWQLTVDEMDDHLIKLCEAQYKLSVAWDDYNEAFAAFLSTRDTHSYNAGKILTGRGSTPVKAIKQVLYKHLECLGEDWRNYARAKGDELDD
jgi:hypothetical protein